LKILHIGKYFAPFSGGLENYMRDAMVALGRRGIQSAALVHRHTLSLKSRDEEFIIEGQQFQVTRTGLWARLAFTPISPVFPWHLRRMIRQFKPDVLHLHLPNPSVFWALVLPSARRIPWLIHWHSDVVTLDQGWLMKFLYRLYQPFEYAVLKHAKVIVATSSPYLDSSNPLRKWISKCHVVPLGLDVGRFSRHIGHAGATSPNKGPLQVLAVGRLTYYKGFRYLIEAAARVPEIHINLVGHGDQAEKLKALATSMNLQDRVTFHGTLSDADLVCQMSQCDCLCLPSVERTEAFGMVLLEAMYFGKATVISDVPGSGMGWVVDDGITGIKVPPMDTAALAEAFNRLVADPGQVSNMGQRGKNRFDRKFEINHAVGGLVDLYQQVTDPDEQNQVAS
jgi:rhamnosyl/mannosyltransferase